MNIDTILSTALGQGPVASLLFAAVWYGVRAYQKLLDRLLETHKAHSDALMKVVVDNTEAWNKVKEKLDASVH